MNARPYFSVIVPFYNEGENLPTLIGEIDAALRGMGRPGEILLVDDGSTDGYRPPPASPHYPVRWLRLDRNSGQSAAMYFGLQGALGEVFILLDADLQNDPADFAKLVAKLEEEKLDLVTGVRTKRHDTWARTFTSRMANRIRSTLLNDHTTDTGCTLKALRREVGRRLPCWNGMHRFIPAHALACGFHTGEVPVNHRARHAGVSKVIAHKRAIRATYDLLGMLWFTSRQVKGRVKAEEGE